MKIRFPEPRVAASSLAAPGLLVALGIGLVACGGKPAAPGGTGAPAAPAAPAATASTTATTAQAIDASTVARSWSGTQAAVDGAPARTVGLDLRGDGTASLTIEIGEKKTVRTGKWRTDGPTVQFDPIEKDGSPGSRIVWSVLEGRLVPNAWSGNEWGAGGPPALDRR